MAPSAMVLEASSCAGKSSPVGAICDHARRKSVICPNLHVYSSFIYALYAEPCTPCSATHISDCAPNDPCNQAGAYLP